MNKSPGEVVLERTAVIVDMFADFADFELEELKAVHRYCANYHQAYQKRGDNHIVTEISIEPM